MKRFGNQTVVVTGGDSVNTAVSATEAQLGPIDRLVNNAGWDVFKPFTKTEPSQWVKLIADRASWLSYKNVSTETLNRAASAFASAFEIARSPRRIFDRVP